METKKRASVFKNSRRRFKNMRNMRGLIFGVFISVTVLTLLGAVITHALILQTQNEINVLQEEVDEAKEENRILENSLAQATAPESIIQLATERLGMVTPTTIIYIPGLPNEELAAAE